MIRIVVADDHAVVHRGLTAIAAMEPDMAIEAGASNAEELFDLIKAGHWDAVVLDIGLAGRNGLDVLAILKKEHPTLPVLVFTMHPEEQFAVRALQAGASGYLTKDGAPNELVTAIRTIVKGGIYVSETLGERLASHIGGKLNLAPHELLSDREYEVLRLLATGNTVSELAHQLNLSVKTVSTYRSRILKKMKMTNNAELIRYAVEHRITS